MRSTGRRPRLSAYVLLVLLTLVWGIHWPIMKAALAQLPPFTYGALRIATAIPVIVLALFARREASLPPREDLGVLLVVGLAQIAGAIALVNLALQAVPPGRSSVLAYTTPFWAALIQAGVLGVALGRREIGGVALGVLGIAILLNPTVLDWSDIGEIAGSVGLLVSAAFTAVSVIVVRRHRWRATPLVLQPWELLVALIPTAVLALVLEGHTALHAQPITIAYVLYSGPLATAFAYWASQVVSRELSPTVTTMGMLATPVVGLVASAIAIAEPISALDLAGFAVTIAGIAVVTLAPVSQAPRPALPPIEPAVERRTG